MFSFCLTKPEVYTPSFATYTNGDADTYYQGISTTKTDTALLTELRSLNSLRRKSTVGYDSMGTSASGSFKYTDYNPATVKYDNNNQPYGTKVLSFYSGTSTNGFNREHTWPKSHGGNLIEADIHMTRPTISSENGSRGNSFYVEGMCSQSNGWDPAEEDFGDETYRGDAARIIFYGCVASSQLSLIDESYHSTSNNNRDNLMGKLSDLIKWHLNYAPLQREKNRNEGAEYLQGNRNPFIDHPEYVCRVWGNTNATTKALCANDPYANKVSPTSFEIQSSTNSVEVDSTLQLSVGNFVPTNAYTGVSWSSSDTSIASVSNGEVTPVKTGNVTITATSTVDTTVKATIDLSIVPSSKVYLTGVEATIDKNTLTSVNETAQISAQTIPSSTNPSSSISYSSSKTNVATVNSSGVVKAVANGKTNIVIKATQGSISYTTSIEVTVNIPAQKVNVTGVNITKSEVTLKIGQTETLTYQVLPSNATNKNVSWVSSNPSVVSVNNGVITALKSGNSVITVTTEDGSFKDTCNVTVSENTTSVTGVNLNYDTYSFRVGDSINLVATVAPYSATNKNVVWSSANPEIATVNNDGLVTAVAEGETTITVETVDGCFKDECVFRVFPKSQVDTKEENNAGCSGNILTTSILLSSLSLFGLIILIYKKKQEI